MDAGELGKVTKTPQGGIRAPAYLTRVGVFDYRNPDGSLRREYRPASEVFHADALASLADAPVTDGHPGMVTTRTYKAVAAGHVSGGAVQDDDKVAATLIVQDEGLIADIHAGKKREVSCGYTCDYDPTPGVWEGQAYDGTQRTIRYNHVAIVPRGRAGKDVALRLDAAGDVEVAVTEKVTFDAVEYDKGGDAHLGALMTKIAKERDRADQTEGAIATLKAANEKLVAETSPERIDALVSSRLALRDAIAKVAPKANIAGLSPRDAKCAALKECGCADDLSKRSDAYIDGRFDALVEAHREDACGGVGVVTSTPTAGWVPPPPVDAVPAWQRPLARSSKKGLK